jgi:hypothetical protein
VTWLQILTAALQLVAYIARRAERIDVERALLNELEIVEGKRVRAAQAARDDVVSGRVPEPSSDPYRRD